MVRDNSSRVPCCSLWVMTWCILWHVLRFIWPRDLWHEIPWFAPHRVAHGVWVSHGTLHGAFSGFPSVYTVEGVDFAQR